MGLPLYLAMTAAEMAACPALPRHVGWFSPAESADLPETLPPGALLILTDRQPLRDTDALAAALRALGPEALLLDFERPPEEHSRRAAKALAQALPCPVAAPPGFLDGRDSPVFLPPCPLHVPLADYLTPWQGRAVWLDMTLAQQTITVTKKGTRYGPVTPADRQGGQYDDTLCCRVITEITEDAAIFTIFDTPDTLKKKLARAEELGVSRAVGLWQEL